MTTRVCILEDEAATRQLLEEIVQNTEGMRVSGVFARAEDALTQIGLLVPHVFLVDLRLAGMGGVDFTQQVRKCAPHLKILIVSGCIEGRLFWETIHAGAHGYLTKPFRPDELRAAIKSILSGSLMPVSQPMMSALTPPSIPFHARGSQARRHLSHRESEVLTWAAQGYADKQIAALSRLSKFTINGYWKSILRKFGVHSRSAAIACWFREQEKSPDGDTV